MHRSDHARPADGPKHPPEATPLPHPYAPQVKTRYLHQLLALAPTLRRWRRDLLALHHRPHAFDRGALLRHAWDHVPFWRDHLRALGVGRHGLDDPALWPVLPVTTREDLQTRRPDLIARRMPSSLVEDSYEGCTSGSTGEPVRYRMSAAAYHSFLPVVDLALALHHIPSPRPGRGGIALLDALGHSPEYAAWLPLFHATRFAKITTRPGWQHRLRRLAPAVVTGDPDSLEALLDSDHRPRLVLSSAFAMPPTLADTLRRHLGCPVVEYYSAQELGPMALAGPDGTWHVLSPYVWLEATPAPGGGDMLLVTDARNPLMPLIRYAIGDLGRVGPPRGALHAPTLEAFTGRVRQRFVRADGTRYDPAGLAPSLARLPIRQYRLSQTAPDAAELEHHGPRDLTPAELEALRDRLSNLAGAPIRLTARRVLAPLRAPGHKPEPFVPLGEHLDRRAAGNHDAPVAGRPHRVYIALTNACNRACPWCSTHSGPERGTYIDDAAFAAALPPAGDFELQLEGGEPTLHPRLFELVALAEATGRCRRYVLCTNGVRLPRAPAALRRWLTRWPRPLTIKISVNHHLLERDPKHLEGITALAAACHAQAIDCVINLRRRPAAPDRDAWVRDAVDAAGLLPLTNDFWLQRYGMASDDQSLEAPYLAGTGFTLVNPDGSLHGTDLIARSEAMGSLP